MKKLLLSACLLLGIAAGAQNVSIPDPVFKNWLLSADLQNNNVAWDVNNIQIVVDANDDNEIQESEAEAVWSLNLGDAGISDAAGIEGFTNLRELVCHGNPDLTTLDLTSLVNLETFICDDNTGLESLTFAGLANLHTVFIMGTNLDTIDLTGVTGMINFTLQDVPVTSLDFPQMISLTKVGLYNTNLVDVNLGNSLLNEAIIIGNLFLETINVKNGDNYSEYILQDNPQLAFMCVDEGEDDLLLQYFENQGMAPPFMSTDCDSAPGDNYNLITGNVRYDYDGNGCSDEDYPAGYVKVKINDGFDEKIRYTNADGDYFLYVTTGDFNVSIETGDEFNFTPLQESVTFTTLESLEETLDFCLTADGILRDAEVVLVPIIAAIPGFTVYYQVVIKNKGNQVLSGTASFTFNDILTDFMTAIPQQTGLAPGIVSWNYTDLLPFETRSFYVSLNVNAPTETPPVNIGDILASSAAVTCVGGDDDLENNIFEFDHVVTGSFDPNNVICLEGAVEETEAIGEYLHYVVNFENTGDEAASFVIVSQDIDETMYDLGSFELISTSHKADAKINGNKLEFRFDDIDLGAQEKGNIVYRIKSLQTLEEGDAVSNSATLIFDYNIPIPTNDAVTIFETLLGTGYFIIDNSVTVYPNPAKDMVKIEAVDATIKSIQLYDIQGRLLQTGIVNEASTIFDMSGRANGVYFLKIITDKGMKVEKLIRE